MQFGWINFYLSISDFGIKFNLIVMVILFDIIDNFDLLCASVLVPSNPQLPHFSL